MKIFFVTLLAASVCAGYPAASARTTDASGGLEFSLLPSAKCDEAADIRQCLVSGPKDWSPSERLVMQAAMGRLLANELVQGLVVGARENGYTGLRRYSTDTKKDATYGTVPKFSPGFIHYGSKVIGITDLFFDTERFRDPISDYRFGDLMLLHELVHAFDDRKGSNALGFTSVSGWVLRNDRWAYVNPVGISEYNGVYAETLALYARGNYGEAWTRSRSFATSMTFPLPTIQSLATPGESFADILAHLLIDSRAATYLKPQVVAWFESNVFPTLRENARRFRAADYLMF
jgi:hypothetical protein